MPATNASRIGADAHLRDFEARLAAEDKNREKAERKELYKKKILKQSISQYRRGLDRISMGKRYSEMMGVPLINVLAELEGPKSNSTKNAIKKMRDDLVLTRFGVVKVV